MFLFLELMAPGHQLLVTFSISLQPANSRTLWLQNKRHLHASQHRLCHAARALPNSLPVTRAAFADQTPQETLGLIGPPSANLTRDDDQESPRHNSGCPHLVLPGHTQSCPIRDVACACHLHGVERQVWSETLVNNSSRWCSSTLLLGFGWFVF